MQFLRPDMKAKPQKQNQDHIEDFHHCPRHERDKQGPNAFGKFRAIPIPVMKVTSQKIAGSDKEEWDGQQRDPRPNDAFECGWDLDMDECDQTRAEETHVGEFVAEGLRDGCLHKTARSLDVHPTRP